MSSNAPALLGAAAGVGFGHAILPDHWVPLALLGRTRRYPLLRVAKLSGLAGVAHVLVSLMLGAIVIVIGLQFRAAIQNAQAEIVGALLIATGIGISALELAGHSHHHGPDADNGEQGPLSHHVHRHHDRRLRPHRRHKDGLHHHGHHVGYEEHGDHVIPQTNHDHHGHQASHDHGHNAHPRGRRRQRRAWPTGILGVMVPFGAAASPDLTILPVFLAAATAGVVTAVASLLVFAGVTIGTIVGLTLGASSGGYRLPGDWLDRWGNVLTAAVLVGIGALVLAHLI